MKVIGIMIEGLSVSEEKEALIEIRRALRRIGGNVQGGTERFGYCILIENSEEGRIRRIKSRSLLRPAQ